MLRSTEVTDHAPLAEFVFSVFSALLGPTVITCYASVYGVVEFQVFSTCKGGLRILRSIPDSQDMFFGAPYLTVTCSWRRLRST